ncbi:hypothetical protein BOTBODRAFT_153720 [Botryobasidium botryosum FD-172 SS1]|uniref:Prephenate/arogenate dehydrogenase domain-containing protein n=1 Tax=Botryobasidium botryosum (strain FD-172 SS1) TaxID=930990 RepID=A0A067MTD4_BOTB1|nr:hypothetical protein BOTBODRAFT_153720 [Botryobasidium botryosum FD-172 SS1]
MVRSNVTPDSSIDDQPTIGLIGMGAMGMMYAQRLSAAGWKKIHVCDRPEKYEDLKKSMTDVQGVVVYRDGHGVSRSSDFILYSVEAEFIDRVVAEYGPSTKVGAIVGGQTSVKAPEKEAFEKYLPEDVHIVSCHSLHAPSVNPQDQPLVLIKHRAANWALTLVENILRPFRSRYVYMTYEVHDLVTANTQAVTHAAFLSMGTAWRSSQSYPWEQGTYVGGIETVKVNIMLRIYANKWHVYAGLAILNPQARPQIDQFAKSATELYKLMLGGDEGELRRRIYAARDAVFGPRGENEAEEKQTPIFLSEAVLDQFSLGTRNPPPPTTLPSDSPKESTSAPVPGLQTPTRTRTMGRANSHLSILAMVDCWAVLHIRPFAHLELAATPVFRMWIGIAEYLFRSQERLDAAIAAALWDVSYRSDDLEFVIAARGWSQCVSFGSFELYADRFQHTAAFFEARFDEAVAVGSRMIKTIVEEGPR